MSYATTLAQIRNDADAIIIGRPTQAFLSREHAYYPLPQDPDDSDPTEYVSSEWTEGDFEIEQVLWQKSGHSLLTGQSMRVVEPVGIVTTSDSEVFRSILEDCYEIKRGSRYVLFIVRGTDGTYVIDNHNLGRFNTDGTDIEDEFGVVGGLYSNDAKSDKQLLREELTAA